VRAGLVTVVALASAGFVPVREPPFIAAKGVPVVHRHLRASTLAGWHAIRDADTGVPIALYGSTVAAPGSTADPAAAERAARAFLAAHIAELAPGSSVHDFDVVTNELDGALRTVAFRQLARGLPVIGGGISFVFGHDRLFAVSSHALPDVRVAERGGHAVLPLVEAGTVAYHAVDVVEDGDHWEIYRSPGGSELARANKRMYATGTLVYDVGERYATGTRIQAPAPGAQITVDGTATATGSDGTFSWAGTGSASVVPSLTNSIVQVTTAEGSAATATLTAQPGADVVWSAASDELADAQISTFIYGNIVKARDRRINPAAASWLDTQFPMSVNEAGACNAYATSEGTHFYASNAMCQNTGRLADIVFHEFGHAFHYHSYLLSGSVNPALSEGVADFNAANITGDPGVGRGFYYTDEPVRQIDPRGHEWTWPEDVIAVDPHQTGLIFAGAMWDLRSALVHDLGTTAGVAQAEAIFAGVVQRSADIPSTYMAALVADDDDADLGNGTPHYCAIERAFGRHGLAPGFADTTVAPPVVDDLAISVAVTPPASTDCPAAQITAVRVTWHTDGGTPATFDLAPGASWTGSFPEQPPGTVVHYTVEAERDDGTSILFPQNPGDPEYQLFVGPAIPIWCEPMDKAPLWTQDGNYGMEWNWAQSLGTGDDPIGAHTGTANFGTEVGGNGYYPATTSTWTETPAIDVSSYAQVHLQYWRWLTVEDRTYDAATIEVNGQTAWQNAISPSGTLNHTDREWRFQDLDLTPYITDGTASVRWTLDSDSSNEFGGWNLDDVCLVALIKYPLCGDGIIDNGEQCDDGNTASSDGCSATCQDEPTAGGGGCSTGGGGLGWLSVLLGAAAARGRGRRGRSRRGCRNTCAGRADRHRPSA
jgi:cysteine-rich repeat protein